MSLTRPRRKRLSPAAGDPTLPVDTVAGWLTTVVRCERRTPLARALTLRLALRPPYDPARMLAWLAARAVPGVETVERGAYRRVLALPSGHAVVELRLHADHVDATMDLADVADLPTALARCRRLLDLDADPVAIAEVLAGDPALGPRVAVDPGLRVPGSVDPQETAFKAVLGQQISVAAARTHAARLVALAGSSLHTPTGALTHAFPTAGQIARADLDALGMPDARRRTLGELARRLADGRVVLDPGADRAATREALLATPGVGPWTADYVALRGLGDPDAFPATDLVLVRVARALGVAQTPRELKTVSERWRPWRAYAAHHLWSAA